MSLSCILFSKTFSHMSVSDLLTTVTELGYDGIDLTVRGKGHVDTEQPGISVRLREVVQQAQAAGLSLPLLTTNVLSAADPHAEEIFMTAGEKGVPLIKLGYARWTGMGSYQRAVDEARRHMDGIEKLALKAGVCATIHNHSGEGFLSAMPLTVRDLVHDRDPRAIGVYLDGGHVVAEGAAGSWRQALDVLASRVVVVGCKSYRFDPVTDEASGTTSWKRVAGRLMEGLTPWAELLDTLRRHGFTGPITFHSEYGKQGDALLDQCREDLRFIRALLAAG